MTKIRTVLCFGDSNTYGAVPTLARSGRHRFGPERRWPGIMRRQLGSGWDVVEEGQPSRTTVREDPIEGVHKSGLRALPICLESHMPLDLVIVMLGTNDLKYRFAALPGDIADSVEIVVRTIQRSEAGPGGVPPRVILVAPPAIQEVDWLAEMFQGGAAKSLVLAGLLRAVAERCGTPFIDAGEFVESSAVDGLHLDSDAHRRLGIEVARAVQEAFAD
ncbi:MAG: SGNH/GDSL hydrolase family protein [Devosia sp.]